MQNLPPQSSVSNYVRPCQIRIIRRIARRIPLHRNPLIRTGGPMTNRDIQFLCLNFRRGLDKRRRQSSFNMPFNMTMEELDTRIIGYESDGDGAVAHHEDGVSSHWGTGRDVDGE